MQNSDKRANMSEVQCEQNPELAKGTDAELWLDRPWRPNWASMCLGSDYYLKPSPNALYTCSSTAPLSSI